MIASLNSDCSVLTLSTESLITSELKTFTSLKLKSRLNCSLTETSVDISSLIDSINNSQISIPASLFYNDVNKTKYCDGIYYFQLEVEYTQSSVGYLVTDSKCQLIDCDLRCKLINYFQSSKDRTIWHYYNALVVGSNCDTCFCTEMCSLYNEIKILLNDNSVVNSTSGCGCT